MPVSLPTGLVVGVRHAFAGADPISGMNHLVPAGDDRWRLDRHAQLVVYEAEDGGELLTIYDCAAAQKPPSLQTRGHLVRVDAAHELHHTPTGYVVKMREPSVLEQQADDHYVVRAD